MASANYVNEKTELGFRGPEGDQEDIVMERDMTPTGNIWDQTSLASDWSSHVEEEEASGAGKESLREPELSLEEAEGFEEPSRPRGARCETTSAHSVKSGAR